MDISQLSGCKFYTNGSVPDPYPGHYYSFWPSTPTQIPYDKGFAGIYLSNCGGLNIGKDGATSTVRNKFYQLRNGIVMRNGTATVFGSDFYNFEGSVIKLNSQVLLDLNQYGIHVINNFIHAADNTFDNIKRGIYTHTASAKYMTMSLIFQIMILDLLLIEAFHHLIPQSNLLQQTTLKVVIKE